MKVIDPDRLFVTFRKSKTLGDQLVHSRYPYTKTVLDKNEIGNQNCRKCNLCKNFLTHKSKEITSCFDGKQYFINKPISCTDEHVIYVIDDLVCKKQNVGSTDSTMRIRFANHKSHIKNKIHSCKVADHYNKCNAHKFSIEKKDFDATLALELKVTLVDKIIPDPWDTKESITKKLLDKESFWQHQLHTLVTEGGLNARNERIIARKKNNPVGH